MCGKDSECYPKNFLFSNTEPWRLYSPENRHSKSVRIFYLVWRWSWALLFTVFLVLSGALPQTWYSDESQRIKYFIYLTNWGYLSFCIAQICNAIVSTVGYVTNADEIRWYMKINWFLYNFTSSAAILISLLFWALIYTIAFDLEPDTFFTHGFNGLFVLLDIWVTAMPVKVLHFYIPGIFAIAYIIFSLIYTLTGGTNALLRPYIYSVLDWSGDPTMSAIYSVGATVGVVAIHFLLYGLFRLRLYVYEQCVPTTSTVSTTSPVKSTDRLTSEL